MIAVVCQYDVPTIDQFLRHPTNVLIDSAIAESHFLVASVMLPYWLSLFFILVGLVTAMGVKADFVRLTCRNGREGSRRCCLAGYRATAGCFID